MMAIVQVKEGPAVLETQAIVFDDLLDRNHLAPAYQSVVDLATGEQVGAEALARWPNLGITPEDAFRWATQQ